MKINIETSAAKAGEFCEVRLVYRDGSSERRVLLKIRFKDLHNFSKDTSSLSFDFFLISSVVYGIDNLLEREQYSVDGWAREIQVVFPVKHPSVWQRSKPILQESLNFLTGDYWDVSFEKIKTRSFYKEKKRRSRKPIPAYDKIRCQFVNLFSGGLDSLVGAIESLEATKDGHRLVLVSHFDENATGPNKDQNTLVDCLKKIYPDKIDWVQGRVFLQNEDLKDHVFVKDHSYRSRSLLFIGIGVYVASSIESTATLLIPENGTISLNYPLTPSRSSSLSTRTTHPFFLARIHDLLKSVGIKVDLSNPYQLKTKGELVQECKNRTVLKGIYSKSVSCGKRGRKQHWENRTGTQHCGICMPCIYRRAALHKLNWDKQLYGVDLLNRTTPAGDAPALFDYLKTNLSKEQIKRGLLVNGSLPLGDLDELADVVMRSRDELISWIRDGGNQKTKNGAGIT